MNLNSVTQINKIEELFKHSFIYGITSSLQNVLGFIMLPILTVFYTPEIFGVYSILLLLSAFSSSIFYLGASSALGRYYYEIDSKEFRSKILTTSLVISLVGACFLIILGYVFSEKISILLFHKTIYSKPIELMLIGTAFTFLLNLMTLLLRYDKKSFHFFFIIISGVLINFLTTYILLSKYKFGLLAPIYGIITSNGVCFFVIFFSRVKMLTKSLEIHHFKIILNFGIQTSFAGLFFYVLEWVDRLIIKDFMNLNDVGVYSLGYRLGSVMNFLVIMPFTMVWSPLRMQYANNSDADVFTGRVLSYYTLIGVIIIVIAILFGEDFLNLIFVNKSYSSASAIFPIIMFSIFFWGYQNIVDFGIYLHKKVYIYIIISFIAILINIFLNLLFIPKWGYLAAAYITLFTYFFTSTSIYFVSNQYFKIKIEKKRVILAIITIPILFGVINFFAISEFSVKVLIASIILYLFYRFWLNQNEKSHIKNILWPFLAIKKSKHE